MSLMLIGPLTARNPAHWAYVPVAEQRIRDFVTRFGSDQDPDDLVRTLRVQFVADTGHAPCWLWGDADGVRGHLLAWLDAGRRRVLFVGQVWSDVALGSLRREVIAQVDAYARRLNCTALEGWVENPAILRLYRKIGLATPVMTAVRRTLDAQEALHVVRE